MQLVTKNVTIFFYRINNKLPTLKINELRDNKSKVQVIFQDFGFSVNEIINIPKKSEIFQKMSKLFKSDHIKDHGKNNVLVRLI